MSGPGALAKLLAITASIGLHAALALALLGPEETELEGGLSTGQASLGSSFADMAVGTVTSEAARETVAAEPPETAAAMPPADAPAPARQASVTPSETPSEPVQTPEAASGTAPKGADRPIPPTEALSWLGALPTAATAPVTPVEPAERAPSISRLVPTETVRPTPDRSPDAGAASQADPTTISPTTPQETVIAGRTEGGAMMQSPRPVRRPRDLEERMERTAETTTSDPPDRSERTASPDNSAQNARAGSATGEREAPSARANQGAGSAASTGNAAASNYPGKVMQRLSRVPRPSVRHRGATTVSFRIAGNGGLAGVGIAASSGSAALDREAVRLIQRAAPFPAPPSGARTQFSINIEGR